MTIKRLLVCVGLALVLAGCGSSEPASTSAAPSGGTQGGATTSSSTTTSMPPIPKPTADWLLKATDLPPGWHQSSSSAFFGTYDELLASATTTSRPYGAHGSGTARDTSDDAFLKRYFEFSPLEEIGAGCTTRDVPSTPATYSGEVVFAPGGTTGPSGTVDGSSLGRIDEAAWIFPSEADAVKAMDYTRKASKASTDPSTGCNGKKPTQFFGNGTTSIDLSPDERTSIDDSCGVADDCMTDESPWKYSGPDAKSYTYSAEVTIRKGPAIIALSVAPASSTNEAVALVAKAVKKFKL